MTGSAMSKVEEIEKCAKEIRDALDGRPWFSARDPIVGLLSKIQIVVESMNADISAALAGKKLAEERANTNESTAAFARYYSGLFESWKKVNP